MPSQPIIQLDIIPDTEVIETFNSFDNLTIPNDILHIKGNVEITLERPIDIRELYVQFRGAVESVISVTDFYYNTEQQGDNNYGDEIPVNKWNTMDSSEISFVESISRKALGNSNSILPIVDEKISIINKQTILPEGKSIWPFTIKISNAHQLPPSILLPHHIIKYTLSAKIKLSSLSEWVRVKYWNARMNTLSGLKINTNSNNRKRSDEIRNISSSRSMESVVSSSSTALSTPPLSPTNTIQTTDSSNTMNTTADSFTVAQEAPPPHYNNTDLISAKLSKNNNSMTSSNNKNRQLLDANKIIQICRHSYPSMTSLDTIPRIRFRGARKDRIKYEVGMDKFTCLQKKNFTFKCKFDSLSSDAKVASIVFYLEQIETYPIRAGDYNTKTRVLPDEMVPRYRKFSRKKHDMEQYENETELRLSIPLDLPQISPRIETPTLDISHKLKLIIRFVDETKERKMSLSFPISVGTVPTSVVNNNYNISSLHRFDECSNEVHVRQELDQWLSTPDTLHHIDKLPSYLDALQEGYPPSPFLDSVRR